jgi:hypothetical protein
MKRPRRAEEGSAVVELAPVILALLALLVLIIGAGRITVAVLAVHDAARNAAREASIARAAPAAVASATSAAQAALSADHLHCAPVVTVDTAGFSRPPGEPATVAVTVTCTVSLTGLPGFPGARTITATSYSPLDVFRAR